MATFNSRSIRAAQRALLFGVWLTATSLAAAGQEGTNAVDVLAIHARAEFQRAAKQFQSNTNDPTAAWEFARACFHFADFATNDAEHAAVARQGIAASRRAIALESNSAPAHYYLGQNLGQLARTETLSALKIVREMERAYKTAAVLDAHFDYAGPERSLGLLYRDAPGWPMSLGSRRKARAWLERAEALAPEFPENHLNLAESDLQWHDRLAAKRELQALDALWPIAKTELTGPAWEQDWADWSARRETVRKSLGESCKPAQPPKDVR